jgi:hypothetical protein
MFRFLRKRLRLAVQRAIRAVARAYSRRCKPLPASPLVGTIADLARSKPQLVAENLLLRQQLIVLNRADKRPHCTRAARVLVVVTTARYTKLGARDLSAIKRLSQPSCRRLASLATTIAHIIPAILD